MLQDFIQRRPHSKILPDAIRLRDSIAFTEADRKHTSLAYQEFCQTYPLSHLASRATDSVYAIEYRLTRHYDAEQYYRGYGERFPESPYTPRCIHLADSIEYFRDTGVPSSSTSMPTTKPPPGLPMPSIALHTMH